MARPRLPKHAQNILQINPSPSPSYSYSFSTKRTARGVEKPSIQSCIFIADGQSVTQEPNLPVCFGQSGFREFPLQNATIQSPHPPTDIASQANELGSGEGEADPVLPSDLCYDATELPSVNTRKREAQMARWESDVIPKLLIPYMHLLQYTNNLHDNPQPKSYVCTCPSTSKSRRHLEITVVRFHTLTKLSLEMCECCPAAIQLVEQGLFPCAPLHPTLAVDIRVLNFVNSLFVHIAPNYRAWCDTVMTFLKDQGYQMQGQDPLRQRFANTLQWYNSLRHSTKEFVDRILIRCRQDICNEAEPKGYHDDHGGSSPSQYPPDSSPPSSWSSSPVATSYSHHSDDDVPRKRSRIDEDEEQPPPRPPLSEPSEYLWARCPLCFGGSYPYGDYMLEFDAIVCIDACFTQKHNKTKSSWDPPRGHPDTVFMPEEDLQEMEDFVDSVRGVNVTKEQDEEDGYDPGLKVPRSALNGCEASFTAADKRRTKSSTQFFDSTALMALMCRHDRVLWLANMTSTREKQHYVLALIETLFKHLPPDFRVGVLYDVGCKLHRSCVKWDFLVEYLDCLGFAVSVFHAFGHDWPCQLIYHPWKRAGFGLSDGEGCERFWHSISHLIAYLRIQHADKQTLLKLGSWLRNKWSDAHGRLSEAQHSLDELDLEDGYLREQWDEQVHEQTQPQPRQNKNLGKKAVEEVLALRENRELLLRKVEDLEDILLDLESADYKRAEAGLKLPQAREKLKKLEKHLESKERQLGIVEDQHQKIHSQISQSLKRREPGIQSLARDYNSLVVKMEDLIRRNRAPANAVLPERIPIDRLFTLDVDDSIWQDVGLTDKYDNTRPPGWLADDPTREGIRALLERDRCREEIKRLSHERNAMQAWFADEWYILMHAISETSHPDVLFQLRQRRSEMLELCWRWQWNLGTIPMSQHTPEWGPSEAELNEVALHMKGQSLPDDPLNMYSEHVESVYYDSEESEESDVTDYNEDEFNVVETFDVLDSHNGLDQDLQ
ncbi:hypothetical protein V5O48_014395 [Marasmius crinis-equi]|uniref:CxC1-like cysteine cluster associated with KDZ transposases domain-containing protein n=1 Tax=Marasmius crinis-equi TaxID=585013 RepID=A0ABR3EXG8_9AGAR